VCGEQPKIVNLQQIIPELVVMVNHSIRVYSINRSFDRICWISGAVLRNLVIRLTRLPYVMGATCLLCALFRFAALLFSPSNSAFTTLFGPHLFQGESVLVMSGGRSAGIAIVAEPSLLAPHPLLKLRI